MLPTPHAAAKPLRATGPTPSARHWLRLPALLTRRRSAKRVSQPPPRPQRAPATPRHSPVPPRHRPTRRAVVCSRAAPRAAAPAVQAASGEGARPLSGQASTGGSAEALGGRGSEAGERAHDGFGRDASHKPPPQLLQSETAAWLRRSDPSQAGPGKGPSPTTQLSLETSGELAAFGPASPPSPSTSLLASPLASASRSACPRRPALPVGQGPPVLSFSQAHGSRLRRASGLVGAQDEDEAGAGRPRSASRDAASASASEPPRAQPSPGPRSASPRPASGDTSFTAQGRPSGSEAWADAGDSVRGGSAFGLAASPRALGGRTCRMTALGLPSSSCNLLGVSGPPQRRLTSQMSGPADQAAERSVRGSAAGMSISASQLAVDSPSRRGIRMGGGAAAGPAVLGAAAAAAGVGGREFREAWEALLKVRRARARAQPGRATGPASTPHRPLPTLPSPALHLPSPLRCQAAVGSGYHRVAGVHMGQMRLLVFARNDIAAAVEGVVTAKRPTGVRALSTHRTPRALPQPAPAAPARRSLAAPQPRPPSLGPPAGGRRGHQQGRRGRSAEGVVSSGRGGRGLGRSQGKAPPHCGRGGGFQ